MLKADSNTQSCYQEVTIFFNSLFRKNLLLLSFALSCFWNQLVNTLSILLEFWLQSHWCTYQYKETHHNLQCQQTWHLSTFVLNFIDSFILKHTFLYLLICFILLMIWEGEMFSLITFSELCWYTKTKLIVFIDFQAYNHIDILFRYC